MAKRGALNEMTHDNWDQEEEVEDAGVFRQASDAVIKQRPMKKAKRRVPQSLGQGDDGEGPKTAFKGFSGFVSSNKKPVFSLKQDSSKPLFGSFSNGRALAPFSLGVGANMASGAAKGETGTDKPGVAVNGSGFTPSRSKYLQQLRALNESVAKWITEHVNKNGHCVLTPIFKDYEKHLAEVEKLNPDKNQAGGESASEKPLVVDSKEGNDEKSSPAKEKSVKAVKSTEVPKSTPFSFSAGSSAIGSAPSSSSTPLALFGSSTAFGSSSAFGSSGFSFGSRSTASKGFSFGTASAAPVAASSAPEEDEDYVPPTEDVTEVKEDDAFYTKKCKLYFQKNGSWVERGVGHIHLKPCGEKTQFIIRADTNLGNILMNIMLSASIPLARQGKNNVTMLCMANPPIDPKEKDPKPTSFLIRVKTGEEADELLEKLKESQK